MPGTAQLIKDTGVAISATPIVPGPPPKKKRIDSVDAFRGFTIFAMIFVIQVAGYRHLPLTFPQFGSAPVSTFKHAGEDGEPSEWAFWEGKPTATKYREAKVVAPAAKGSYDVVIPAAEGTTTQTFTGVAVWAAKPLHPGENIIAVQKDAAKPPRFQGIGNGCTFTDWVAPFFVFIVGVCIPLSRRRRGSDWWKHVGIRTLGLIIAGVIYISLILKLSYWWGILQAIGIAYFMGAASMFLPTLWRWVLVAVIAAFHGWATWHIPWWVEIGDKSKPFLTIMNLHGDALRPLTVHCTPWASISYGLCTIIGTFIGEALVTRNHRKVLIQCLAVGIICSGVGYLLHRTWAPMNKDFVSPAYTLFTAGLGAFVYLLFYAIIDIWGFRRWTMPLNVYGSNALLAYFMQPVVRVFVTALGLIFIFQTQMDSSGKPVMTGYGSKMGIYGVEAGLLWTMLLWLVVLICNRKKIYWKL